MGINFFYLFVNNDTFFLLVIDLSKCFKCFLKYHKKGTQDRREDPSSLEPLEDLITEGQKDPIIGPKRPYY